MPFAAGGGPDLLGRLQAQEMTRVLGVAVNVENRVGAGGVVAAEYATRAKPDGYTMMLGASSHLINKLTTPAIDFDPVAGFSHVSLCWTAASVLVVPASASYAGAAELVAAARASPGAFSYASGGIGTIAHLAGAAFVRSLGLAATHVPYRGSVEIEPALLRGDVQFAFPVASTAVPAVGSGGLRALAVTATQRLAALPQVPTLLELYGDPLLAQEAWGGLWLPRGAPRAALARLFEVNDAVLRLPAIRRQFAANGAAAAISKSPEDFSAFVAAEYDKWRRVLRLIGLLPG